MKMQDLKVALKFFLEDPMQSVTIQVPNVRTIPIIRRAIADMLGAPDAVHGDRMKYHGRYVYVESVKGRRDEFAGIDPSTLFYVGFEDGSDLLKIDGLEFMPAPRFIRQWELGIFGGRWRYAEYR